MTNLNANTIKLRQAEPPEGRQMYPLGTGPGGGDGMNFAVGTEVFQWNPESIQSHVKPSAILGLWVDARNLTAGKNLIITTPYQVFVFAGGNQGYIPMTSQMPFQMTVTTNGGTGVVNMIAYNYNPLFTGAPGIAAPSGGSGSGGGTGGGSGGSGGGFGETGGSGGGRPTF